MALFFLISYSLCDIPILLLPIVFQNLINVGATMTDVVMLVFSGLTAGASVLAAQYWGKRISER